MEEMYGKEEGRRIKNMFHFSSLTMKKIKKKR